MQNLMPMVALEPPPVPVALIIPAPCPNLAGLKVRMRGTEAIYLIDPEGYRRLIPFPMTFLNLFEDRAVLDTVVMDSIAGIAEGPSLDNGAVLLRGTSCERIYLLDRGRRRLISSPEIMAKYEFSEEAIVVAPRILIDAVPEGDIWE